MPEMQGNIFSDGNRASHLGDAALHDEEVGIVDIQLHRMKQILHTPARHRLLQLMLTQHWFAETNSSESCSEQLQRQPAGHLA